MNYPLGWPVLPGITVRRERRMERPGLALVEPGQEVQSDQIIARIQPLGAGGSAPFAPARFGAQTLRAGLHGQVIEASARGVTIEGLVAVVQGLIGVGGQAVGEINILSKEALKVPADTLPLTRGVILVVPGRLTRALLEHAAASGVAGLVASSMTVSELEGTLSIDMTAVLDGLSVPESQHPLPVLLFTEGLGDRPMASPTLALMRQHGGDFALLSGTTNPRRNLRPELLISLPTGARPPAVKADPRIITGSLVRVSSGEYAGEIGQVIQTFQRPQRLPSGIHARAVYVRLERGVKATLPIYNLERIA
ncbi:MAG TPA: hypothetical protein VFU32_04865 [Ktedonobacterales bacterium]|nr:hypothetical protein [Ktedonobacterales bacterium]